MTWRICTNATILLIRPLGTKFSGILIGINTISFKKMHLSSEIWRSQCDEVHILYLITFCCGLINVDFPTNLQDCATDIMIDQGFANQAWKYMAIAPLEITKKRPCNQSKTNLGRIGEHIYGMFRYVINSGRLSSLWWCNWDVCFYILPIRLFYLSLWYSRLPNQFHQVDAVLTHMSDCAMRWILCVSCSYSLYGWAKYLQIR